MFPATRGCLILKLFLVDIFPSESWKKIAFRQGSRLASYLCFPFTADWMSFAYTITSTHYMLTSTALEYCMVFIGPNKIIVIFQKRPISSNYFLIFIHDPLVVLCSKTDCINKYLINPHKQYHAKDVLDLYSKCSFSYSKCYFPDEKINVRN